MDTRKLVKDLLADLNPRQKKVLESRYGLAGSQLTLAEVGPSLDKSRPLTRERVRQMEVVAIRKLRALIAAEEPAQPMAAASQPQVKGQGARVKGKAPQKKWERRSR